MVEDTTKDKTFAANPLVVGSPNIRFYAGKPLVTRDGYPLGTLCVLDTKPRCLSAMQKEILESLGKQAMSLMELRLLAKAKSTFLSRISHELRTPLHGVIGFASMLAGTNPSVTQAGYIKDIDTCGQHLLMLVNDMLLAAKLEHDPNGIELEKKLLCIEKLLEDAILLVPVKAEVLIMYEMDPSLPTHILGDELRLRQCIVNLLGNAVKFTKNGFVLIRVGLNGCGSSNDDESKMTLLFSVQDTGIGIGTQAKSEQLFQAFTQESISSKSPRHAHTHVPLHPLISKADMDAMSPPHMYPRSLPQSRVNLAARV